MKNKLKLVKLAAALTILFNVGCRSKTIVYDPSTGEYATGRDAKNIIAERNEILEAREQARDRDLDRNIKRRESSRYVSRESIMFGQSIDEFDVLAARERTLQAEADVARTQAENMEAASRANSIIDYEKRYERALGKMDRIEVLPRRRED